MQFTASTIALFASVAASLPAPAPAPQIEAPTGNEPFSVISSRSASAAHLLPGTAWKGNLLIGGSVQDATCDTPSSTATFVLNGDEAFLYSTDNPPQQLYVDRSGMGQGKSGYITGAQPPPRNGELKGWGISEEGYLVFDGQSPQACPTELEGKPWSLWFSNLEKPGFNEGCLGVSLLAVKSENPISCTYSSS